MDNFYLDDDPPNDRAKIDPCDINPCKNGGSCVADVVNRATSCKCPPQFEGKLCEKPGTKL